MKLDQIYVINLNRKPENKKRITARLKDAKLLSKTTCYSAVDGKVLADKKLKKWGVTIDTSWEDPYSTRPITKGEIGCALSHYFVWKKIAKSNYKNVLILEDDANFGSDLKQKFNKLNPPKDTDLIYLGRKVFNKEGEDEVDELLVKPNFSYWTIGYIVTKECCQKLLQSNYLNKLIPVDEFLPIMYNKSTLTNYCDLYGEQKINIYAVKENWVTPEHNAFLHSETEKSIFHTKIFDSFLLVSVATDSTDGFKRFESSLKLLGYNYKILGMGDDWNGGNMAVEPGGGKKIIYLQDFLKTYKGKCKYICFSDAYDVVALKKPKYFWNNYRKYFNNKIVFSAEKNCWPDKNYENRYPKARTEFKFLNSGGFIGPFDKIKSLIKTYIEPTDDDQLYYTKKYLYDNEGDIVLDSFCKIFQTLASCSISSFALDESKCKLVNRFENEPSLLHGNGVPRDKLLLNQICNYVPFKYRSTYGYVDNIEYNNYTDNNVLVSFFAGNKTIDNNQHLEFLNNCLERGYKLFIWNPHCYVINEWFNKLSDKSNIDYYHINDERTHRVFSLTLASMKYNSDYYFCFDNTHNLKEMNIVEKLISKNKNFISPLLVKENNTESNIWMSINNNYYYERSFDYLDIVKYNKRGLWNIAYTQNCYCITKSLIEQVINAYKDNIREDIDIGFNKYIRKSGIFMHTDNIDNYGLLL